MQLPWSQTTGKKAELPKQLRPPPLFFVIFSLIITFVFLNCSLSFALGPLTLLMCAVFVLVMTAIGTSNDSWSRAYPSTPYLVIIFIGTVVLASYLGIRLYIKYYVPYHLAISGEKYTDASVRAKPGMYGDAGIIEFSKDAAVDTSRGFGLKSSDYTYCVAPIISTEDTVHPHSVGPAVTFWAVGRDCCSNRGNFACDGAEDLEVRSAFVAHDATQDVEDSGLAPGRKIVIDFLTPQSNRPKYMKAVESACALYHEDLRCDLENDHVVLLRWAAHPEDILEVWHHRAIIGCVLACVIYSVFIVFLWTAIHFYIDKEVRTHYGPLSRAKSSRSGQSTDSRRPVQDPFMLAQSNA